MTYPVHERFFTFQGEGVHVGRSAFFIRLYGCPVHCPWCDSAGTWHAQHKPTNLLRMTCIELAAEAKRSLAEFVVVTGGEPTVHHLDELVDALHFVGMPVHLETSGAFDTSARFDWITVSPKREVVALPSMLNRANEWKLIVDGPMVVAEWCERLKLANWPEHVWLHPEWSHRTDGDVLAVITEAVKCGVPRFRAGWQMHKLFRADTLDSRAAATVPLGGDSTKGSSQ